MAVKPSPEWKAVAEAQQNKDAASRAAIALPLAEFRKLPYRPPPLPTDAPIPDKDIAISEQLVRVRDGADVSIRIYQPLKSIATGILFFNVHGGGFVLGVPQTEEWQNRVITKETGSVTVSVDYRRAPEHPYPCALNDCFDVLLWCKENAHNLDIDPERIVVIGGSAGANICAVLALKCRNQRITGIIGQVLNVPVTCHPDEFPVHKYIYESYECNADAPVLSAALMRWLWKQYLPNPSGDLYASPLLAESLVGLPPALIQVAGWDPLRDEGLAYAQALQDAGVPTALEVFDGLPHAFYIHPDLPSSKVYINNMVEWIKRLGV